MEEIVPEWMFMQMVAGVSRPETMAREDAITVIEGGGKLPPKLPFEINRVPPIASSPRSLGCLILL